jgi:hypothetical protein
MTDPITEAISSIISELMKRGVSIQPEGDGWLVRFATESHKPQGHSLVESSADDSYLRSW